MRKFTFLLILFFVGLGLQAQTARLQVIHNSPSPTVDIWVNGSPYETDFAFREATEFRTVPAGVELEIGIAVSPSSSPGDIIATFPVTLTEGETYVAIANGVVGDMMTPFNIEVLPGASESSNNPGNVDIGIFHGSPDAPNVDVDARRVITLVEDLPFASFEPYQTVPAGDFILDVRPAGSSVVAATFSANLTSLGGQAGMVFTSGYLGKSPEFGLYAALPDGTVVPLPALTTSRLQIIHNSPEPTVDVWVNNQPFRTGIGFREATEFIDVPANTDLMIGIAPSPSSDPSDIIYTLPANLLAGETYVAMASGVVGDMNTPFGISVFDAGRESSTDPDQVDLLVFHGSPDAPSVDIDARNATPLVQDLAFGSFTESYISVPADRYILDISAAGTDPIVISFEADLSAAGGASAVVFASGFLGNTPSFGVFAALPDGTVLALPAIEAAHVQIIHNSPSPTVDIWVNDEPFKTDFAFRDATAFLEVPAGVTLNIGIAVSPSSSPSDIIATFPVNLTNGENYQVIANGVVGDMMTPFNLEVLEMARLRAVAEDQVDILAFHGSPDAPSVDIRARGVGTLFPDLQFAEGSGYASVPADRYILDISATGTQPIVASFEADLSILEGQSATVIASGYLGQDPMFGLFAVLADGTVVPLPAIQAARLQIIHNSPSPTVDIWVNDAPFKTDFAFRDATAFLEVPAGVILNIGVAPSPSSSPADIIATFPVELTNGSTYIAMAHGVVGNMTTPFDIAIYDQARESSGSSTEVDLLVFHGSPNAPTVDVTIGNSQVPVVDNLEYGTFNGYLTVPAGEYQLNITPANDNTNNLFSYNADISSLGGGSATVFATGFLGQSPAFGLWVALANGTTFPLSTITSTVSPVLGELSIWPNPVREVINLSTQIGKDTRVTMTLVDVNGQPVQSQNLIAGPGTGNIQIPVPSLPAGIYFLQLQPEGGAISTLRVLKQ